MLFRYIVLLLYLFSSMHGNAQTAYLFAHGLWGNQFSADYYVSIVDKNNLVKFNFPDAQDNKYNGHYSSLAQKNEIECLHTEYQKLTVTEQEIIICGVSRGASTIINFMGSKKPQDVKALVLESPFAYVGHVLHHLAREYYLNWLPSFVITGLPCLAFGQYSTEGEHPIHYVRRICKRTPILLICTTRDELIPYHSTVKLYRELLKDKRQNVHLLILDDGSHANLLEHPTVGLRYKQTVHAFYKEYNLPYNAKFACKGESFFKQHCQPTAQEIDRLLANN